MKGGGYLKMGIMIINKQDYRMGITLIHSVVRPNLNADMRGASGN